MAKSNRKPADLQALELEYSRRRSDYDLFGKELTNQFNRLLDDAKITIALPTQSRVKEWISMKEKLDRVHLSIASISDMQDLLGMRIMLLFSRDVDKVCEIISSRFTVVTRENTQERLSTDRFGYSSVHFVIELPSSWLEVPTLARFPGLRAEIQVRTLAQHIWAAASHSLQYKREDSVPPSVRRAIHRASALLETVDLEFERVLEQRDAYRETVNVADSDEPLNVDLLRRILDDLLPAKNKDGDEDYADLLPDLFHFGIKSSTDLRELIAANLACALKQDHERAIDALVDLENGEFVHTSERIVRAGAYFNHIGLTRELLHCAFSEKYREFQQGKMYEKTIGPW